MPSPTGVDVLTPGRAQELAAEPPPGTDDPYWLFYEEVAAAQLAAWLPPRPVRVLDLSGDRTPFAAQMASAGHQVVKVLTTAGRGAGREVGREAGKGVGPPGARAGGRGSVMRVVGDARSLDWLASASLDAVVAEGRALSFCLATEATLDEVSRVLRPGGRLLLSVDSLLLGLARLAEQHRWAELADVPAADVVLVPADNGTITRCFWPEELQSMLSGAGLAVEWIRPRTVLSAEAVDRAVASDLAALPTLVRTEVALAAEREGESIGIHLVASARKPG